MQDFTAARKLYEQALAQEDTVASRFNLALLYLNGLGVNPSSATARAHVQKAAAINQNDFTAAMNYYETEADQGDANAQYLMGYIFHHALGLAHNEVRARTWYEKAAQQRHAYAEEALEKLGIAAAAEVQSATSDTAVALMPEVDESVETRDDAADWLEGNSSITGRRQAASRPTTKTKTKKAKQSKKGSNKKKK